MEHTIETPPAPNDDACFIAGQGVALPSDPRAWSPLASALLFQPRVLTALLLAAMLTGAPLPFHLLSALLAWSALLPRWSPFDLAYHALVATRGGPRLGPAAAPRRFAQGLASTWIGTIGATLEAHPTLASGLEVGLAVVLAALVLRKLCAGTRLYHAIARRLSEALGRQRPASSSCPGGVPLS